MVSILAVVLAVWQSSVQAPQGRDTRAWYQAYQSGVRQVASNPTAAIADLQASKRTGPPPGRRRSTAGDNTIDFLPDYHLGLAYLNAKRYAEAEAAFGAVRDARLIADKDPEFRNFDAQSKRATFEAALETADQELKANRFDASRKAAARAAGTYLDTGRVTSLTSRIEKAERDWQAANQPKGATNPPADPKAPSGNPPPNPVDPGGRTNVPPAATGNTTAQNTQPGANRGTGAGTTPTKDPIKPNATPGYRPPGASSSVPNLGGAGTSPAMPTTLQAAMASFFSGEYAAAARELEPIVAEKPSPQASFYLACSRAALVLSGRADQATLDAARADFARAGGAERFSLDRRYISPRILQLLEGRER